MTTAQLCAYCEQSKECDTRTGEAICLDCTLELAEQAWNDHIRGRTGIGNSADAKRLTHR